MVPRYITGTWYVIVLHCCLRAASRLVSIMRLPQLQALCLLLRVNYLRCKLPARLCQADWSFLWNHLVASSLSLCIGWVSSFKPPACNTLFLFLTGLLVLSCQSELHNKLFAVAGAWCFASCLWCHHCALLHKFCFFGSRSYNVTCPTALCVSPITIKSKAPKIANVI